MADNRDQTSEPIPPGGEIYTGAQARSTQVERDHSAAYSGPYKSDGRFAEELRADRR